MSKVMNQYTFGDMQVVYVLNEETGNPELVLLPAGMVYEELPKEKPYTDSLLQIKLKEDDYPGGYAGGTSMRMGPSVLGFGYDSQAVSESDGVTDVCTVLKDTRGYLAEHHLTWRQGEEVLRSYVTFRNNSAQETTLEMLASFSLGKLSPFMEGDGAGTMKLHRLRSVWSMEGRLVTDTLEDLQLEPSWGGHAVRCERFGTMGSYGTARFIPTLALEDSKNHIFWGVQIAHNASWQLEVYRRGDFIQVSGGLADREFGQWMKNIAPGESFTTPEAILSVCCTEGLREEKLGDPERIFERLTTAVEYDVNHGPESEQDLPVMFNEYCTTWGDPSHDNICGILDAIDGKGFSYFVIDCGWYREAGVPWDVSMGDYNVSKELFPQGLDKTVQAINAKGMKAGIWFEIDNVGPAAKAYHYDEHLLQRDGRTLTTTSRRFWDLKQDWVQDYLTEKVIGTLNKYGFKYMKIDCNDNIGLGCDGAESPAEGLRQNQEASIKFVKKCLAEVPGLVLENCASGGYREEPLMMSLASMCSFSDAHECEEIPVIAANLHNVVLPRQSQIWAVIHDTDSLKRIGYSVANTFLGRMCLSGDVENLSDAQWKVITDGIAFYKKIAPIIKKGHSSRYGTKQVSYRHLQGWQGMYRENEEGAFVVLHGFDGATGMTAEIPVPADMEIVETYSHKDVCYRLENGVLSFTFDEDRCASAVLLRKKD